MMHGENIEVKKLWIKGVLFFLHSSLYLTLISLLKAIVYVTNATNNVVKNPLSISFIDIKPHQPKYKLKFNSLGRNVNVVKGKTKR